jgi:hypothetical protein
MRSELDVARQWPPDCSLQKIRRLERGRVDKKGRLICVDEKQLKKGRDVEKERLGSPECIEEEQLQRDHVADKVASDPPKYINEVRNL